MSTFVRKVYRIIPAFKTTFLKYYNRIKFYLFGVQFGKKMCVSNSIYILGKGEIVIGDNFTFTSDACHNPICRNIRGAMFVPNKESKIIIGNRVGISSSCIWAKESIIIGNDVNIGGDTVIMDNDVHPHDYLQRRSTYAKEVGWEEYCKKISSAPVIIEDDVWIGSRCQILKGVHIGARTIIGAGSVVTKNIPSDCIAAGNPCKVIRQRNSYE